MDKMCDYEVVSVIHDNDKLQGPHDIEVSEGFAYVAGKWGSFTVIDIRNPYNPNIIGYITNEIHDAQTVLVGNNHCFLGCDDFLSIDISEPNRPVIIKRISDPKINQINGMVQWDRFILAVSKIGYINIFDVKTASEPVLYDNLCTKDIGGFESPHDIAIYGDYVVIVNQKKGSLGKVGIYRFKDKVGGGVLPSNEWILEGRIDDKRLDGANRIVIDGIYAYVAGNYSDMVGIIDISNPETPFIVSVIPTKGKGPDGLTKNGHYLFVGADDVIQVINVKDSKNPIIISAERYPSVFPSGIENRKDVINGRKRSSAHDLVYDNGFIFVTAQSDNNIGIIKKESNNE